VATLARHTPAPESIVAVAPFRAWRGSQYIVAGGPARATIVVPVKSFLKQGNGIVPERRGLFKV